MVTARTIGYRRLMRRGDDDADDSMAKFIARLSILGVTNRRAYRLLREIAWRFVIDNSLDVSLRCENLTELN